MKAVWDDDVRIVDIRVSGVRREDVTEVPGVVIVDSHAPEPVFDVEFGEDEWFLRVKMICHGGNDPFKCTPQL